MAQAPTSSDSIRSEAQVVVNKPVAEVFQFWRALENFPRFMSHVHEVRQVGEGRYLWRVSAPAGTEISWEARVTAVDTHRRIAWAAEPGSTLPNRGEVRFRQEGSQTHVHVTVDYEPPAGVIGHAIATLLGKNPGQQMTRDLGRLKSLLEDGQAEVGGEVVSAHKVRHDEAQRRSVR